MNLDKAIEAQIFANNKKISKLLEENEALLRRAGFNPNGSQVLNDPVRSDET